MTAQETAQNVLRRHFVRLTKTISDPLVVAMDLFEEGIIGQTIFSHISQAPNTRHEKSSYLLQAVFDQITTDDSRFTAFLAILRKDVPLRHLVESMETMWGRPRGQHQVQELSSSLEKANKEHQKLMKELEVQQRTSQQHQRDQQQQVQELSSSLEKANKEHQKLMKELEVQQRMSQQHQRDQQQQFQELSSSLEKANKQHQKLMKELEVQQRMSQQHQRDQQQQVQELSSALEKANKERQKLMKELEVQQRTSQQLKRELDMTIQHRQAQQLQLEQKNLECQQLKRELDRTTQPQQAQQLPTEVADPPIMPELIKFRGRERRINIPQEISTKYFQFGILLLEDKTGSKMDNISHNHTRDPEQVNLVVLQQWVKGRGKHPVTWSTLIEVLRDAELNSLANEIESAKL